MTKKFTRLEGGGIESTAIAHMTEGAAKVISLPDLSQLCGVLQLLQAHQAITCGVPLVGDTLLTTRTGAALRLDAVARTNEAFGYILTKVDFHSFPRYEYVSQTSLGEMTGEILIEKCLELVKKSPPPDKSN